LQTYKQCVIFVLPFGGNFAEDRIYKMKINNHSGELPDKEEEENRDPTNSVPEHEEVLSSKIDWEAAARDMSFADEGEIMEESGVVALRKPGKEKFFRVRGDPEFAIMVQTLEIKDDLDLQGNYLVPPNAGAEMNEFFEEQTNLIKRKQIVCCTDARGQLWLWPVAPTNSDNRWHRSARSAAESAKENWIRMVPRDGEYRIHMPASKMPEPAWPDVPFKNLLESAFEGRIIDSMDHPIVEYLLGSGQVNE
jgi:hypothetical protein